MWIIKFYFVYIILDCSYQQLSCSLLTPFLFFWFISAENQICVWSYTTLWHERQKKKDKKFKHFIYSFNMPQIWPFFFKLPHTRYPLFFDQLYYYLTTNNLSWKKTLCSYEVWQVFFLILNNRHKLAL